MDPRVKCADCKFWLFDRTKGEGTCHRNPPYPEIGWPTTLADDWCGAFERREHHNDDVEHGGK